MKKVKVVIVIFIVLLISGNVWGEWWNYHENFSFSTEYSKNENNQGIMSLGITNLYTGNEGRINSDVWGDGEVAFERPDQNEYNSNSSFGFIETEISYTGTGEAETLAWGSLESQSQIGEEPPSIPRIPMGCSEIIESDNWYYNRSHNYGEAVYDGEVRFSEAGINNSASRNVRVEGHTYSSEKVGNNYRNQVSGLHVENTTNLGGEIFFEKMETGARTQETGNGVTARAVSGTSANIPSGGIGGRMAPNTSIDMRSESFSQVDQGYGRASVHSWSR